MRSNNYQGRRKFLKTTGAATLGITLAGCSGNGNGGNGGNGNGNGGNGGNGGTTDGSDDEPITVGASAALTGQYSLEGTWMKNGYELWAYTINEFGGLLDRDDEPGLLGREVELVVYDDESDPQRAVNLYQRLIEQDEVDLLMGPYSSAVATSVLPIIDQAQMASIFPMMSDTSVLQERDVSYVSQAIAPSNTYLLGAIELAAENGAETAAIMYENTAFPTDTVEGHVPRLEDAGIEVVYNEPYPAETSDYTQVLNPVDEDVDIVMGGGYTPDAIGLTQAAKSLGLSPGIFSWMVGGTVSSYVETVGSDALGMSGDLFWAPWFDTPYSEDIVELAPEIDAIDEDISEAGSVAHLCGGFSGALITERAVKNVGEINHDELAAEMRSIDTRDSDFGIPYANGSYAVNDNGVQVAQAPSLGQWQEDDNGEMTLEAIWPSEYQTSEPVYPHPGWE